MTNPSPPGGGAAIQIGRDAHGPIVVGNGNRVEMGRTGPPDAPPPATPGAEQANTAHDSGTVYAVTHGDLHVHHDHRANDRTPAPAAEEERP